MLKANPCTAINPNLVRTLKREHAEALQSDRAAANFLRFRMNINAPEVTHAQRSSPMKNSNECMRATYQSVPVSRLLASIWAAVGVFRVVRRYGRIPAESKFGAWRVATEVWRQWKRKITAKRVLCGDGEAGGLTQDPGKAVPGIAALLERVWEWSPSAIIADAFRLDELRQIVGGRVPVVPRSRTYQEAGADIQSLRSRLLDSDAGVAHEGRGLLRHALEQVSLVMNAGGVKLQKKSERRSRDDVLSSLLLVCGHAARRPAPVEWRAAAISPEGIITWL